MKNDARFTYILVVLIAIFITSFGTLLIVAIEEPPAEGPLTFSHRWGICTLSMGCGMCLDDFQRLNSSLDYCWQLHKMDEHVEIFGR